MPWQGPWRDLGTLHRHPHSHLPKPVLSSCSCSLRQSKQKTGARCRGPCHLRHSGQVQTGTQGEHRAVALLWGPSQCPLLSSPTHCLASGTPRYLSPPPHVGPLPFSAATRHPLLPAYPQVGSGWIWHQAEGNEIGRTGPNSAPSSWASGQPWGRPACLPASLLPCFMR